VALLLVLVAVLGLAIGSFLNVVVWRVPRGESVVSPPSACPGCHTEIKPYDNVPVVSWLLLRGRCRTCKEPISPRYPLVELATGALFVVMAVRFGIDPVLPAYLWFIAIAVPLTLIDIETKRLPNPIVLPSLVVTPALLALGVLGSEWDVWDLGRAGLGALAMGAFYVVLRLAYPRGLGFGDVKLAPTLGALTGMIGWGAWTVSLFGASLLGGVWSVGLLLAGRAGRKSAIPFGPFLLLATLIAVLWGQDLFDTYLDLTTGS
jgi:leader peptidase (prepilin peptidase)/N-methyltransferase